VPLATVMQCLDTDVNSQLMLQFRYFRPHDEMAMIKNALNTFIDGFLVAMVLLPLGQ
jgi:hypothetical protein